MNIYIKKINRIIRHPLTITVFLMGICIAHFTIYIPHISAYTCNPTGVTKNNDGSFSFARISVNANGDVVDTNGCHVYLLGGEGKDAGTTNDSTDEYHVTVPADFTYIAKLNAREPINMLRVPIYDNAWVTNAVNGTLHYQDFVKAYIKAIEGYGDYIELNTYYQQGNPSVMTDDTQAKQTLSDLGTFYANDPAVFFDVRNEGSDSYNSTVISQNNDLFNTLMSVDPNALKVVYDAGIMNMVSGSVPFYTQSNVIIDKHIYSGQCGTPNPDWQSILNTFQTQIIPYLHAHHSALILNEWGGSCNYEPYNTTIANFVLQNTLAGLNYFYPRNWFSGINASGYDNGILTNTTYTHIFSSSPHPTLPASPTPTLTPSQSTQGTQLTISVCPEGLGNCGDSVNPHGQGNTNPIHTIRTIHITFLDKEGNSINTMTGTVSYNHSTQNFQGTILSTIQTGTYFILVKLDGFLSKLEPGLYTFTNQPLSLPSLTLINGDINNDNQLDILDYNTLISCYGKNYTTSLCTSPSTGQGPGSDINDDGKVDGTDYNLFLREASVQHSE